MSGREDPRSEESADQKSLFEDPEDIPAVSAEQLVDYDEVDPAEEERRARRYPSTIGGMFYLAVLAVTIVGLVWVGFGSWRTGVRIIGGALLLAAAIRLVLRPRDAGMLAVRHKAVDALLLIGVGVALFLLAGSIPNQPL